MSESEPRVVVAHREHLWWLLAEATQLEHMIMCQYLFAEFSFKDGIGEGLTLEQADAVDRWRKKLRGIAIEEMLHIALVANLKSAIGVAPAFGRPNFPQRSGYFPTGVQLDLLPFGDQALYHFLFLERSEGMERQDATEFVPTAPQRDAVDEHETRPRGQELSTVGDLYRGLSDGLRAFGSRLTVQLQAGHGFSALKVGLTFMAWPLGLAITSGVAVRLAATLGRKLISTGTLVLAVAMIVTIAMIQVGADHLGVWQLVPGLALGGLGFGLVAPIAVDIVLSAVPERDAGAASGVTNTAIYVGIAAGVAVIGAIFTTLLRDGRGFDDAASNSLWYAVAAFALGFACSFALPAHARAPHDANTTTA